MGGYRQRFIQVLAYIEVNLDSELDIDKLCQLTHLSKYHFHRQCSAYFGVSVMTAVRLLRLKRAAYHLAYRADKKIVDIALENGYESHEAFSRSFKKHFGQSPSKFRQKPNWDTWNTHYAPILVLRNQAMSGKTNFEVTISDFPETLVAALAHKGSPNRLSTTIRTFIEWRKAHKLSPDVSRTFNLAYSDPTTTSPGEFRFDICCSIPSPISGNDHGIKNKTIPAGKCAVIRHVGSDDSIGIAVKYLYSNWLETSSFKLRDFPVFFERVKFFPEENESEMVTDIYLPIE
ncbi:GyrI-like domain-containing protein [Microbulbifer sp. GL-2]|uniref:AraC family transcriptional regulator n=1 Tax=Microbulbifer sp. GL-2 TaxID=2591606 RepID=UPI001162E97F|nr:AraC family transcriptional regulator [Microbulbifer sp. GL-2]BBM04105.1 transcriptional regulator [Microbulbifer sp. GL-2]